MELTIHDLNSEEEFPNFLISIFDYAEYRLKSKLRENKRTECCLEDTLSNLTIDDLHKKLEVRDVSNLVQNFKAFVEKDGIWAFLGVMNKGFGQHKFNSTQAYMYLSKDLLHLNDRIFVSLNDIEEIKNFIRSVDYATC
ncbi:hypothetical protein pv_129 [Pithovirus sibericum]|uniref:Uncharacterized protein n=1 Tax=Pithovirus sibericum TaxID=1450746 RepID=W5S4Q2_9VIRU|nr:hypothetical protein pv_129 [Pithovirus sibericum]AHH01696.1 hypothetical protein pv_129 [Pithovirus sibericum]WIL05265.1 hypothetical protein pmam_226 [Pithovirus mammoth]